ncbi:hypothetical protein H5410_026817 [Solanum commersonii]|uniref:Uncharacterized protein n=1 Tax=Solanum commersonii TaxID=4109 RepID=A0A9J5YZL0_SOLCO|nr:hypothetical protein H5410_026817 [Solanum commersonii]
MERWECTEDTSRHATSHYTQLNQEAARHTSEAKKGRVVLFYNLMKGLQINVGSILRQNMLKFCNNKRWHFCYDSLLTWFLRSLGLRKKCMIFSHPALLTWWIWMGHMVGMAKLQLWISGRSTTEEEMTTLPIDDDDATKDVEEEDKTEDYDNDDDYTCVGDAGMTLSRVGGKKYG